MKDYHWIKMILQPQIAGRKTGIWNVETKEGGAVLGQVKWWSAWRCYCFFPKINTLYEKNCLWDIADFCAEQTTDHKTEHRRQKEAMK